MQLQVTVDQKEALRRGINAPAPTAKIEVHPARLSPEVREFIANRLENGYDLTGWHCGEGLGSVIEPTVAGLVSQIEKILARFRNEEMDVDSLTAEVKRATELIAGCKSRLRKAEEEVSKILES